MEKSPPLQVCVPPLFDNFPISITGRRPETGYPTLYDLYFGKMILRYLFDKYFEDANRFRTHIKLNYRSDDLYEQFSAGVAGPLDNNPEKGIVGDVIYSFKSNYEVFEVHHNIWFSVPERTCTMRSTGCFPELGFGTTCILPIISRSRLFLEDYPVMSIWCDQSNVSAGATFDPRVGEYPISNACLLTNLGRITAGVQYEPKFRSKVGGLPFQNLANWSGAISYGSVDLLTPTFHFGLELANNSKFIASFYKHIVLDKSVKTPFEYKGVPCGSIRNYIDFGFELQTRMDDGKKLSSKIKDFTFQIAASWQFSEHLLLKGKVGPLNSSIALALKSWGRLPFTFSVSAIRDRTTRETSFGFGIKVDTILKPRLGLCNPNIQQGASCCSH